MSFSAAGGVLLHRNFSQPCLGEDPSVLSVTYSPTTPLELPCFNPPVFSLNQHPNGSVSAPITSELTRQQNEKYAKKIAYLVTSNGSTSSSSIQSAAVKTQSIAVRNLISSSKLTIGQSSAFSPRNEPRLVEQFKSKEEEMYYRSKAENDKPDYDKKDKERLDDDESPIFGVAQISGLLMSRGYELNENYKGRAEYIKQYQEYSKRNQHSVTNGH